VLAIKKAVKGLGEQGENVQIRAYALVKKCFKVVSEMAASGDNTAPVTTAIVNMGRQKRLDNKQSERAVAIEVLSVSSLRKGEANNISHVSVITNESTCETLMRYGA
jgi:hypothetical protein